MRKNDIDTLEKGRWVRASTIVRLLDQWEQEIDEQGINAVGCDRKSIGDSIHRLQQARANHATRNHYGRILSTAIIGLCGTSLLYSAWNGFATKPDLSLKYLLGLVLALVLFSYVYLTSIHVWDFALARFDGVTKTIREAMNRQMPIAGTTQANYAAQDSDRGEPLGDADVRV